MFKKIKKGFTLVELVVVIAIIAVLAGVSVAGYLGYTQRANKTADQTLVKQLDTLVKVAEENEIVNATEMRKYFKANGISNLSTKDKNNVILYDLNKRSVTLATSTDGTYGDISNDTKGLINIDKVKYANVIEEDGAPLVINEKPSCPEEIFAGKLVLSTGGNEFSKSLSDFRNGDITSTLSYVNKLQKDDNQQLANVMANMISTSLFVADNGDSSAYRVDYSSLNNEYVLSDNINYTDINNVIFAEEVKVITDTTFDNYTAIKNIVIPSSVESIALNAFSSFTNITTDDDINMAIAFMCPDNLPNLSLIKESLVNRNITIADAKSVTEAIRSGKEVYISGIKRWISVTSETELATALKNAEAGDAIIIAADFTLTQEVSIPSSVQVIVPTVDNDTGYQSSGFNHNGSKNITGSPVAYRTLTISGSGKIVIQNNGTLLVNSISGQPSAGDFDQDVNGAYGAINLEGSGEGIVVKNGGVLDNYGYIRGSKTILVESGGEARDLYVVRSWRGGSQALHVYSSIYPMSEYDLHNIESTIVIQSGGTLNANVKMFASASYHYTRFPQVDNENGLIRLSAGATLTKTYDATKTERYAYGKETYSISGGATFSSSTLPIVGASLSTKNYLYPIDGDIDFSLSAGDYSFDSSIKGYKFLPGSKVTVGSGGKLTIPSSVSVAFYNDTYSDPFITSARLSESAYPSREAAGLYLNNNSTLNSEGTIAGNIVIDDTTSATVVSNIDGNTSVKTEEANGYMNGLASFTFNATYIDGTKNKVYYNLTSAGSYSTSAWMTLSAAIADFKTLSIVETHSEVIVGGTSEYTEAQEALAKYNAIVNCGITDASIDSLVTSYSDKITSLKNAFNPVFTVNGVSYRNFTEAVDACKNGETLTLHDDYTLTSSSPFTIPTASNLVLDLNGFKLTAQCAMTNQGKLIIRNGSIDYNSLNTDYSTWKRYFIINRGELSVENITFNYVGSNTASNPSFAIMNMSTINSITYTVINNSFRLFGGVFNADTGSIDCISNSSISAGIYSIESQGTIKLIDTCSFVSLLNGDGSVAIYTSTGIVDEIRNTNIYSHNGTAIEVVQGGVLKKLSGLFRANSTDGVINAISNTPIQIMNNTYFKNDRVGSENVILHLASSSSDPLLLTPDVFSFESNYVLSSQAITSGQHAGYYSTSLGYAVTFVDTLYNESNNTPYVENGSYIGQEISNHYYSDAQFITLLDMSGHTKDSTLRHYVFEGWMDSAGNVISNAASIQGATILFAKYSLSSHTSATPIFVQSSALSYGSDTVTYGNTYSTIEEAIAAVTSGDINISLIADYTSNGIVINIGQVFNLNLNGHNINFTEGTRYGFDFQGVRAYKNVIITGEGTITMNSSTAVSIIRFAHPESTAFLRIEEGPNLVIGSECPDTCSFVYMNCTKVTYAYVVNATLTRKDGTTVELQDFYQQNENAILTIE